MATPARSVPLNVNFEAMENRDRMAGRDVSAPALGSKSAGKPLPTGALCATVSQ
jgi:hypothetical protein